MHVVGYLERLGVRSKCIYASRDMIGCEISITFPKAGDRCTVRHIPKLVAQPSVARTCPSQGNSQGLTRNTMRPTSAWRSAAVGHKGTNVSPTLRINTYEAQNSDKVSRRTRAQNGVANHCIHMSSAKSLRSGVLLVGLAAPALE